MLLFMKDQLDAKMIVDYRRDLVVSNAPTVKSVPNSCLRGVLFLVGFVLMNHASTMRSPAVVYIPLHPLLLPLTVAMATVIPISVKTAPLAQETVVPVPLTMVIVVAAVAVIVLATTALGLTNVTLKVERQVARGHVLQEAIAQREP